MITTPVHRDFLLSTGAADWQQGIDVVIRNYYEITGLERGTYYEVRVVAFDGLYRRESEIEVIGTAGYGMSIVLHYYSMLTANLEQKTSHLTQDLNEIIL